MCIGRAGGSGGIKAEHLKMWLRGIREEEEDGNENAGNIWRIFVRLIQGKIPRQMLWMVVVLLPKGGGDYCGIGLLEPFWKCIEVLMDKRLQSIEFHDCLHGFLSGRGTGTAITEAKLTQQLAYLEQAPLYGIFIDLRKAYDAMDRDRCLEMMEAYGVGPNLRRLIKFFWDNAELVCRANGVFGKPFKARRGVTQGGRRVLGTRSGGSLAAFYADDGLIQSRCPTLLQSSFRRQTIAAFIVNRPIFDLCQGGGRRRGSSNRQFWWEQPCDFEEARALAMADAGVASEEEEEELSDF
mmetsp:Transcript_7501/g.17018  ORF Transcript_7501/g.17018 Transcript_7501/m.17018 type:complete len:296 (-) Transcript_7501:86-973(-)